MNNLPVKVSQKSLRVAAHSIIPGVEDAPEGSRLVLVVQVDDEDIVARDFAAFLDLMDRIYGRSLRKGIRSYARSKYGHFKFTRSREGSWELIAEHTLKHVDSAWPIVILWLVLKYFPAAAQAIATSYNQVQQGRLAKANRKKIREEMKRDSELSTLTDEERAELARLVEGLLHQESALLPKVRRFMKKSFRSVRAYVESTGHEDS